ncbi:MAG: transposase [Planctomycetes bacterium]|nr:transposase [Planctomycetota bacterium]
MPTNQNPGESPGNNCGDNGGSTAGERGSVKAGGTGEKAGGTGVPPVRGERITRRNLPHWQRHGATYFLTWRCAAGILLSEVERGMVMSALRHWDGQRWKVYAAVVMPDHMHALVLPLVKGDGVWDLQELVHSVKSFSAHAVNKHRGRRGPVWQDERYDRWMRDEDEFAEKWQYIADNPMKSGLVKGTEEYQWLYLLEERPL